MTLTTPPRTRSAAHSPLLAVGWDVGGWCGKFQGVAAFLVRPRSLPRLVAEPSTFSLRSESLSFADFVQVAAGAEASRLARRIVIAIDAPLGFPDAMTTLLSGRPSRWTGRGIASNPYAYRSTDRHIAARFKLPLSAAFDKLGNNATVAMHHLARWKDEGVSVAAIDRLRGNGPVALEVYPAIVADERHGSRPAWLRTLVDSRYLGGGHATDAVICATLALCWACPGTWGLPHLMPPPPDLPKREGWIYYPESSEWQTPV